MIQTVKKNIEHRRNEDADSAMIALETTTLSDGLSLAGMLFGRDVCTNLSSAEEELNQIKTGTTVRIQTDIFNFQILIFSLLIQNTLW